LSFAAVIQAIMSNTIIHKSNSRGKANHGWLNSFHTFSFANYHNPERMNFGVLRVLNDDTVAAGMGFGKHPHENMEIISIPLEGELLHQDTMGNTAIIKKGDIQVMSAGTGIYHSEQNNSKNETVKFLQIWIYPNKNNVEPRYDQIDLANLLKTNELVQILSPNPNDQGVWIHQNAWFHMGKLEPKQTVNYTLKDPQNGVYCFVLSGSGKIDSILLEERDGMGIWDTNVFSIESLSENLEILLMEVPLKL
jgi:redox-sensitive bicupin YhaK (pirin superfamily)